VKCTRGDGAGDFGALYRALRLDVAGLIREMVTCGLHRLHAAARLWRGRPQTNGEFRHQSRDAKPDSGFFSEEFSKSVDC